MLPAAAFKITRQNLLRPTTLIHEAGHHVAHLVGWNEEPAAALQTALSDERDVAPRGPDGRSRWPPTACDSRTKATAARAPRSTTSFSRGPTLFSPPPGRSTPRRVHPSPARRSDVRAHLWCSPWDDLGVHQASTRLLSRVTVSHLQSGASSAQRTFAASPEARRAFTASPSFMPTRSGTETDPAEDWLADGAEL